MTRHILAIALCAFGFAFTANAQVTAPDGEDYAPAGVIANYQWLSGVTVADAADITVMRDGAETWAVSSPMDCSIACLVFADCRGFIFSEPLLLTEAPQCRMLSEIPALTNARGQHVYIKE
ncbi:hypothetical protein [Ponticaulis sp.]|uniref:hypothetical protein n=1 Tax=Ponticaulis sp. TaxID=2020902 RepID=UPI000B666751|nr:hypothetical protein [Ponticaulis sp.]MAI91139.1 hypothetical protein [Ponticaulis sp.]OUX98454.1 MAG: hypothetical protein CBB65_11880 [Hyphomonadaceae bacterium TMED5]|tara:strand:- start:12551 stop:12913 length:363 start_codon:yes stop_codon:yes gene_type:complete